MFAAYQLDGTVPTLTHADDIDNTHGKNISGSIRPEPLQIPAQLK